MLFKSVQFWLLQILLISLAACNSKNNSGTSASASIGTNRSVAVVAKKADTAKVCASAAEGSTATLKCPAGQMVKSIEFASYGTPKGSCGSYSVSSCNSSKSLSVVKSSCIGNASCAIAASNNVFGDPCVGIRKKLVMQATCTDIVVATPTPTPTPAPADTPSSSANICGNPEEGTTANIACPSGQTITKVVFASYGTPANGSCGSYSVNSCNASTSLSVVQSLCVGKASCVFDINNDLFGDPCVGTGKYLTYEVQCSGSGATQPTPAPTATPVPASTPTPTPIPASNGSMKPQKSCLPFQEYSTASLRAKPKKVFAHYFYPFPLSIDNQPTASDYYTVNYMNPFGENSAFLAGGGFLRARPLLTAPLSSSAWEALNMQTEVRRAVAMGLDGFAFNVMDTQTDGWTAALNMLDAAKAVDPGFKIILMPDMTALADPNQIDTAVAAFYNHPSSYKLADGRLVLAAFYADAQSPTWWSNKLSQLKSKGYPIAFVPLLDLTDSNMQSYASISYGFSEWGPRDELYTAGMVNQPGNIHKYVNLYMAPVAPNDVRPKDLLYWESHNSTSFRNLWMSAINGGADWVQLVTWNDYGESTHVSPSLGQKGELQRTYYDLSSFYLTWFKMGAQPTITNDMLYYFHRRHSSTLQPSSKTYQTGTFGIDYGTPTNDIELVAFLTSPGTLEITIGTKVSTMNAPAGITVFQVPLGIGKPSFRLLRNNAAVISFTSQTEILSRIDTTDLTYQSGSASASGTCYTFPEP